MAEHPMTSNVVNSRSHSLRPYFGERSKGGCEKLEQANKRLQTTSDEVIVFAMRLCERPLLTAFHRKQAKVANQAALTPSFAASSRVCLRGCNHTHCKLRLNEELRRTACIEI